MIEIKIKIEEKLNEEFKETKASMCEVEITEIGKNATEGEIKSSKLIKERLKVNQKIQIENLSKKKSNEEIIEELLDLLKR